MSRSKVRRAAKHAQCERCDAWIERGDLYLESVISPDHDDIGNKGWWRLKECKACAIACCRWPKETSGATPKDHP